MAVELKDFPFWKQLDNELNPYGACNVTSIGMCLYFLGVRGNGDGQLEDQLYRAMESRGLSRHSPQDLAVIANHYGARLKPPIHDNFIANADLSDIKKHLDLGFPTVVHGYFTSFGHIVCVIGYDDKRQAVLIQDPYGEWYTNGYDNSADGRYWLSYRTLNRLCAPDGGIWTHFFSR